MKKSAQAQLSKKPLLYRLRCPVMDYAWGQSGDLAFIPKLLQASPDSSLQNPRVLAKKPAAELWMGAHPKAPSQIETPAGSLPLDRELKREAEHYLGPRLAKEGKQGLSFLFKIIDAKNPLSIQAHPDSQLAKELHTQKPEHYPDPYHKPELALCLADMSALLDFRPLDEIFSYFEKIAVLSELCDPAFKKNKAKRDSHGQGRSKFDDRAWLKKSYTALMQSSSKALKKAAELHLSELRKKKELDRADSLFCSLIEHYGLEDPGIFCPYFFNYLKLKTGEAIFLEARKPHSYIGGVILECMAASDNVVRAGLTSKYRDISTLVEMLRYDTGRPKILRPSPSKQKDEYCYTVPVKDFSLSFYTNSNKPEPGKMRKARKFRIEELGTPSILLVLGEEEQAKAELIFYDAKTEKEIERQALKKGDIFFLPGDLEQRGFHLLLTLYKGRVYRAFSPL